MDRRQFIPALGFLPFLIEQLMGDTINSLHYDNLPYGYCRIYVDDVDDEFPPSWEWALGNPALRISEAIDRDILTKIKQENKHVS